MPHSYPDVDTEVSGYRAGFTNDGFARVLFFGAHDTFDAARDRARRLTAALRAAGETGIRPFVHFSGERPAGFPRNGVAL